VKDVKDVKVVLWSPRKKNKKYKACNLLFFYKKFVFLLSHLSHLSHRHRNTLELKWLEKERLGNYAEPFISDFRIY